MSNGSRPTGPISTRAASTSPISRWTGSASPLWGIQFGDLDTALFENVEAVRGANAIMSGVGNPSATINYIRKRPLDSLKASVTGQIGS